MRAKMIAATLAAAALIAPASAQAHVSLHPNTIPAGAFATLDVRVPGEQEGAYVKEVDVLFPQGFTGVDYENVPGWTRRYRNEAGDADQGRRRNHRHRGLSDRLDLGGPAREGQQRAVHPVSPVAGDP